MIDLLDEQSVRWKDPPNCNIKLKNHQKAMVARMYDIEEKSDVGAMIDFPGSGKSYAILAFILWEKLMTKVLKIF